MKDEKAFEYTKNDLRNLLHWNLDQYKKNRKWNLNYCTAFSSSTFTPTPCKQEDFFYQYASRKIVTSYPKNSTTYLK